MKKNPLIYFVLFFLFFSFKTSALPKYALKEKKDCSFCHLHPIGGGPQNKQGKYYSRNHTFQAELVKKKIPAPKPAKKPERKDKEIVKKEPPPPQQIIIEKEIIKPVHTREIIIKEREETIWDRVALSGNLRSYFLTTERGADPKSFFLMQAEPTFTTKVTDELTFVLSYNFAAPILTAYGRYQIPLNHYFQVGSFPLPLGSAFIDHTALIKDRYDIGIDTREVGVEIGSPGVSFFKPLFYRIAVTNGAREPRQRPTISPSFDNHLGYFAYGGIRPEIMGFSTLWGLSFLFERRQPPGRVLKGRVPPGMGNTQNTAIWDGFASISIENLTLLGEVVFGDNTPLPDTNSLGGYGSIGYDLSKDFTLGFRYGYLAEDRGFLGDFYDQYTPSFKYNFSPYSSIELMLNIETEHGIVDNVANNSAMALFHLWF